MMHIEITVRQLSGCTDFIPCPARLHLGSQNAEGVDTLAFTLPEEWAGKSVSLHIEQADGALPAPLLLDGSGQVKVDRRLTAARSGRWMLTATDGAGYTAYTQPGSYDTWETLPTDGDAEPPSSSLYEQFVAQVMASAEEAQNFSQAAAQSAQKADDAAGQAEATVSAAGEQVEAAAAQAQAASASADRAEAAAQRAEAVAPGEGSVISVNGKGGRVQLDAGDVGALPLPAAPAAGCLLRIQAIDSETGDVTTETIPESDLTSFVRRTDKPTAQEAGPIKLGSGYGLTLTAQGELRLTPATSQQLAAMENGWSPLTPSLVPLAVKLALATLWEGAGWTDEDRAAARSTLGAAHTAALDDLKQSMESLSQRVETLELKYDTIVTEHAFTADLRTLDNLTVTGIWNADEARIEF
ncbi:hypothetical protein B5G28_02110 [Faecalibacterium sp. An77]|uniref:hypothetical protein n=1 Tax=Faecalibacterium sp. An77 TaxID=1965655 RepID=UPI000B389C0C|nr:hypothetical protein [Faecalibacterium sp. An77]OUN40176.1 hypothetical protein B5G28_02110 [Faecalibacterium sp. An77]